MDSYPLFAAIIVLALGFAWIITVFTLAYITVMRSLGRRSRLSSQFSLRALLIAMTVASLGLGWISFAFRK